MRVRTVGDLGALVRGARRSLGMSQARLADQVGVGREWVVRLEKGSPRLEAQLVLDALDAVGVRLVASEAETDEPDTSPRLDALLDSLTEESDHGRA